MKYNPHIHHRRSIRLKGYDYRRAGLYFITICCQGRACLFGHIENGILYPNAAGDMVAKWYGELENKYPDIRCHEMVVMPNHFHCIIENTGSNPNNAPVGADPRVCPNPRNGPEKGEHVGADPRVCPNPRNGPEKGEHVGSPLRPNPGNGPNPPDTSETGGHVGPPQPGSSVSQVVQWFKTMTTNEYIRCVKNLGWPHFDRKLWQRNYWEHIIRNEQSYQRIANYIIENPEKWQHDKFFA